MNFLGRNKTKNDEKEIKRQGYDRDKEAHKKACINSGKKEKRTVRDCDRKERRSFIDDSINWEGKREYNRIYYTASKYTDGYEQC